MNLVPTLPILTIIFANVMSLYGIQFQSFDIKTPPKKQEYVVIDGGEMHGNVMIFKECVVSYHTALVFLQAAEGQQQTDSP